MIDSYEGQEALGVWDFSWSLVAYFILVQGGIVSSINRYVARYRATGDHEGVNRTVSSVTVVLALMASVVLALSVTAALVVDDVFPDALGEFPRDAQWVIFLLGSSLAVQVIFSGFGGVLTGCHRWDLHNAIYAGTQAAALVGMIAVLLGGGSLCGLAAVNLICELGGRTVRCIVAYRVCPGLRVRLSLATWREARLLLAFGGKSFVPQVGELLLNQTTNILVVAYLGPAALAVFSRPRALVRHVNTLVSKFSFVLTPTASSLQATSRPEELREFFVGSVRWGMYITLPMLATLVVLGGPLLRVWMGESYAVGGTLVLMVLALGYLASIVQTTVRGVLTGMDLHGRPGVANLLAAIAAVVLAVVALGPLNGGLIGVALAITVPLTIANGFYIPIYACRRLVLPIRVLLTETLPGPLLSVVPFVVVLVIAQRWFADQPLLSLLSGGLLGGVVLAILYWRYVIPPAAKKWTVRRLGWCGPCQKAGDSP
jgi:O-antigen/teichoic acid export membrane protein